MVFKRLERMIFETGMYFVLPIAKIAGIYEMAQGIIDHNGMRERLTDPNFLTGAGLYFAANAASWLSYRWLNRTVVKEKQEKFDRARERMKKELKER